MSKKEISNGVKTPNEVDLPNEVEVPEEFTPRYEVTVEQRDSDGMDHYFLYVSDGKDDYTTRFRFTVPFSLFGYPVNGTDEVKKGLSEEEWYEGQIRDLIQKVSWILSIVPESLIMRNRNLLVRMIIHDQFKYPWIDDDMESSRFIPSSPTVSFSNPEYCDFMDEGVTREVQVNQVFSLDGTGEFGKSNFSTEYYMEYTPLYDSPGEDGEFLEEMLREKKYRNQELRLYWEQEFQCLRPGERLKKIREVYELEEVGS